MSGSEIASPNAISTHFMMSSPDEFEVVYEINPWMKPHEWYASGPDLREAARRSWRSLKAMCEGFGATVEVQPAQAGSPDLVFAANAALTLDRRALLARFRCDERKGEEQHNLRFFESLRERGVIEEIISCPSLVTFEGAGDAVWDEHRGVIWAGWGPRSSQNSCRLLQDVFSVPAVPLELIDARYYHLDTCMRVLPRGEILIYPAALSALSFGQLREMVSDDALIVASESDANQLAVNCAALGHDIVVTSASRSLREALEERDYRVHVLNLDAFRLSGGGPSCLTLRLDLSTNHQRLRSSGLATTAAK